MSLTFLKNLFNKKEKKPGNLKELWKANFLSEEQFLRFSITQKQSDLDKSKKALLDFLKKRTKKK